MVEKHVVFITPFEEERTLHIYLPDDYQTSGRRYPVMYMYDGHNLFYDEDATYGVSWGLKDYFDRHQSEIIVVGIECNHESNYRLWEFSPYDFSDPHWGEIKGLGKALMEWVVTQLKPMIDDAYPTLPDRAHTAIGGSSMGGLMAIYSVIAHNDVFSKAACLSPFFTHIMKELRKELKRTLDAKTRIYLSCGSNEFSHKRSLARGLHHIHEIANYASAQGCCVYTNLIIDGVHSEQDWRKETKIWYPFLFHDSQ